VALLALLGLPPTHDADKDGRIDPLDPDADGDGLKDGDEIRLTGSAPTVRTAWTGTNPYAADTDGDGLSDAVERQTGIKGRYRTQLATDPCNADTDGDGLSDYDEIMVYDTSARSPDTDGISDGLDPQPCRQVQSTWAQGGDFHPVARADGYGWTNLFAPGLVRFTTRAWVYGLDGESYAKEGGSYRPTTPEDVKNSPLDTDTAKRAIKLRDFRPARVRLVDRSTGTSLSTTTGDGKYRIIYRTIVSVYDADLVNVVHTRVGDYWYRMIRLGLDRPGHRDAEVLKQPDQAFAGVFHTLTETTATTQTIDSLDKLTGELASARLAAPLNAFKTVQARTPHAALTAQGVSACVASREGEGPLEVALFVESATEGALTSEKVLPHIIAKTSTRKVVEGASTAIGVATSAVRIGHEVYLGANASDPFVQRAHYEAAGAEAANAAIWLMPYGWAVQVGWKAITTGVLSLTGVPGNARAETITDPGALIVYAIEYMVLGRIPSEIAQLALGNSTNLVVKDVNAMLRSGKLAFLVPPE